MGETKYVQFFLPAKVMTRADPVPEPEELYPQSVTIERGPDPSKPVQAQQISRDDFVPEELVDRIRRTLRLSPDAP